MSYLKYNWLRFLGYKTVSGNNYVDPDFGDEWVELVMKKNTKIKCASLQSITLREVLAIEKEQL